MYRTKTSSVISQELKHMYFVFSYLCDADLSYLCDALKKLSLTLLFVVSLPSDSPLG